MRASTLFIFLLACSTVSGAGFSLGNGGLWKDICSGKSEEFSAEASIAICQMFLLGYQAGAVEQAKVSSVQPTLCRSLDPDTLPQEFVEFVASNKETEEMDILDVLLKFAEGQSCGL